MAARPWPTSSRVPPRWWPPAPPRLPSRSPTTTATVAACSASNYNVTVAVVDRAGTLRALQRADNAGPHTVGAAQGKAYTSASARANTTAMLENVQKNPGAATLVDIPGFLVLGGGWQTTVAPATAQAPAK